MLIEHYLTDHQDPRTAEKVLGKLRDMLTSGEDVIYLAIQKRPAVTLIPDCIAVTNKRIVLLSYFLFNIFYKMVYHRIRRLRILTLTWIIPFFSFTVHHIY